MIMIKLLLKIFPAGWRQRYEEEFLAVLEQSGIRLIDYANILMAAVDARLHPELYGQKPGQNESSRANQEKTTVNLSAFRRPNRFYGPDCQPVGINSAVAVRHLKVGDRLKKANCIICKNDFSIPPWDYRYSELKHNPNKPCVCERCNYTLHKEAMIVSGITPADLDRLDRMDKIIRS